MTEDKFAEFPETHWVGMKCVYKHQKVDRYMPESLSKHDKALCKITEIGFWALNAGRFCCKIAFSGGKDKGEYWTTIAHLIPLEKPKFKPPFIDVAMSGTNCSEDLERLMILLEGLEESWNLLQKQKKLEKGKNQPPGS